MSHDDYVDEPVKESEVVAITCVDREVVRHRDRGNEKFYSACSPGLSTGGERPPVVDIYEKPAAPPQKPAKPERIRPAN